MKLRSKILLPVGIVLVTLIVGMHFLSTRILLQGFARVEDNTMRVNLSRAANALNETVEQLEVKSGDWSMWDDTYQFVVDRNDAFINSNVSALALQTIQVDGVLVVDNALKAALDVKLETSGNELTLAGNMLAPIVRSYPFLTQHASNESTHAGMLLTAEGPMLLASRPVVNSQGEGEIRGTLMFVRALDETLMNSIQKRTQLRTSVCRIGDLQMPEDFKSALPLISAEQSTLVRPISDAHISGFKVINDMTGRPLLILRVISDRNEYRWGQTTVHFLLFSLIAVAVISSIVVVVLIEKVILRRLAYLAKQVDHIAKAGDSSKRVTLTGEDELSVLGIEMNQMLTSLERAHHEREELARKLVETSRQAGMAEIATGILHNVGNVLNSVNVSTNLLTEKLKQSRVGNLGKAMDLIRSNKARLGEFLSNDARGKELPEYLMRVSEFLTQEHEAMLSEVESLGGSIDHIKQIVAAQQSYAKVTTACSHFDLAAAAEDAVKLNLHAIQHSQIEIKRSFTLIKPVYADRHLVMQILMNLITNAERAMRAAGQDKRVLTIEITEHESNGQSVAHVKVIDSGGGIPAENLSKIFVYGFTTKRDGHGFGLHASANAARQMRGSLIAQSDGEGHGAAFRLELPLQPAGVIQ